MQRLGDDAARPLFSRHIDVLGGCVGAHGGRVVKTEGDGLMAVFTSAVDALACAVAMQQAVDRENRKHGEQTSLGLRVGLHVGEPILQEEDYHGTAVVIAKRLCGEASDGQVVASEVVRAVAGSRGGFTFRTLGELALKGIADPVPACEVVWEPTVEEPEAGRPTQEPPPQLPLPPLVAAGERTPFVGRVPETQQLRECWERARGGQRQLLLLTGEPGIGKTRLATEVAAGAHAEGATVLFGRTDEDALIPYQPFVESLSYYLEASDPDRLPGGLRSAAAALRRLLQDLAAAGGSGGDYRLVDAATSFVVEACRASPLVLIMDDLQWADQPTLSLFRHLARNTAQSRLLLLGTYRETELSRTHPLSAAIADLHRERLFQRVILGGLEEDDVASLVRAWAGHRSAPELARAIHEHTEGNPFFIEEVMRHLAETGAIHEQDGSPTTRASVKELGIPESVKEVIGRRLSRLSEECNSVLTVASVIGRQFGLDRLELASDLPGDRLVEVLDEAVAARVVDEVPHMAGRYSFSHALIYDALYDELTTTRRVRLHGQTLQYADSNGVKLAYEVLGASGPHLIAVGISNCPAVRIANLATAQSWNRVCRHCRPTLYDRRGVGFSAAPDRGYSLLGSVEDLRAVLDAVGAARAVLWGATDGGPLALAFAAQYPERVLGLILLGTTAKYAGSEDYPFGVNEAVLQSFLRTDAVDPARAVSQLSSIREPTSASEAIGQVLKRVPRQVWAKVAAGIGVADARHLLPKVRAPALIIHDPDNDYIPVGAAHFLHEQLPGSRLEITAEYGQLPFPESLYRKIEAFVEEVSAGGATER